MKRVAPTEIKGPHCVRVREGKECCNLDATGAFAPWCELYKTRLVPAGINMPPVELVKKCSDCVDALAELGDR